MDERLYLGGYCAQAGEQPADHLGPIDEGLEQHRPVVDEPGDVALSLGQHVGNRIGLLQKRPDSGIARRHRPCRSGDVLQGAADVGREIVHDLVEALDRVDDALLVGVSDGLGELVE